MENRSADQASRAKEYARQRAAVKAQLDDEDEALRAAMKKSATSPPPAPVVRRGYPPSLPPAVNIRVAGGGLDQSAMDSLSPEERMRAHAAHARLSEGALTFDHVLEAVTQAFGQGGVRSFELRTVVRANCNTQMLWTAEVGGWPNLSLQDKVRIAGTAYALVVTRVDSTRIAMDEMTTKIEGEVVPWRGGP